MGYRSKKTTGVLKRGYLIVRKWREMDSPKAFEGLVDATRASEMISG